MTDLDFDPEYVVMFSGGKGSWAAAKQLPIERMVLLFTDTNGEHPDLYRFLVDAAADVFGIDLPTPYAAATRAYWRTWARNGLPQLVWLDNDGRDIWDVFNKARMIGNTRLSVCSRVLKQKPAHDWLAEHADPAITKVVVGIDWTESHRLPAIVRNYAPYEVVAPLTEIGSWSKDRIDAELADAGIEQPELYAQGFPHNNCAGACVRGGQGQWALLLKHNPERYAHEEAQEQLFRDTLGKDVAILRDRRGGVTKPLTLKALRERIEAEQDVDMDDLGGCGCMTDEAMTDEAADGSAPVFLGLP